MTLQDPSLSVHDGALRAPSPVWVNGTVPPGVEVVPVSMSATVAVHVVASPTGCAVGVQVVVVSVVRVLTATASVPLLAEKLVAPPYAPVIVWVPVSTAVGR